jgi:hypothetical protein
LLHRSDDFGMRCQGVEWGDDRFLGVVVIEFNVGGPLLTMSNAVVPISSKV